MCCTSDNLVCYVWLNMKISVCFRLTEVASGYVTLGIIFLVLRHRNRRRKWRHKF
jgi:hypothetical protein